MAGLIDSTTGLGFGRGLQFQTPIGGAGLIIVTTIIDAPSLALSSSAGDDPASLTLAFDATVLEGDTARLQYANNPSFSGASEIIHVLDASDILAGEYEFTTPMLGSGVWSFRGNITRGGVTSAWSNTVTDTIGGVTFDLDYSMAANSQYIMMGWL